jgi:hypothetical protein
MATLDNAHHHRHYHSRRHFLNVPVATSSSRASVEDHLRRHSMEHPTVRPCSSIPLDSPPSYDEYLSSGIGLRRKFNIQPREDEGQETLPSYSCAISLESVFLKKMELEGAVHRAHDRNWNREVVTLQGTALTFHKYKSGGVFAKVDGGKRGSADFPAGAKRGHLLKSYNLQHAEVGVAADYLK